MADKSGPDSEVQAVEVSEEDERNVELLASRRFMQVALAGEVVFWLLLFTSGPDGALAPLSIAGFVAAWAASVMGVSRGARAVEMSPALRIGFYVLAFGMVVRLVPIAYFLGRTKQAAGPSADDLRRQRVVDEARQRAREREQARRQALASTAAPAAPAASAVPPAFAAPAAATPMDPAVRERLSRALPRIRFVRNGLQEGERLNMAIDLPPGVQLPPGVSMDQLGMPITRATQGVFGVNYMVDDGNAYSSVDDRDLAASGFTLDELHRTAMRNLRQLVAKAQPGLKLRRLPAQDGPSPAIMLTLDGDNETSLLLIDELWDRSLAKHTPNGAIAVMPARDVCVFIDSQAVAQGGMGDLTAVVANVHRRQGHSFAGLLHRQGGRWTLAGEIEGLDRMAPA